MRRIGKFIGCGLIAIFWLTCTACSGFDRLEQKAKLYYGNYCCKTDFDLIRKIKALVSN
jgi:hypothetical protein